MKKVSNIWFSFYGIVKRNSSGFELLFTFVAIVVAMFLFIETQKQVKLSRDTLGYQREKDSIQRHDDSLNGIYQRKRDLATLGNAQRSLELTAKISQATIQPFLSVDTVGTIENLIVDRMPSVRYMVKNSGPTPAYTVAAKSIIIWEDQYEKYLLGDRALYAIDTVGFIVGRESRLDGTAWFYGSGNVFNKADSTFFAEKTHSLLLIIVIIYEDAFGNKHYTQQGFILSSKNFPSFVGLRKYTRTDHNEKKQTTTQTH